MQDLLKIFEDFLNDRVSDIYVHSNQKLLYKNNDALMPHQYIAEKSIEDFLHQYFSPLAKDAIFEGIEQDRGLEYQDYFFRIHAFLSCGKPALIFRVLPKKIHHILEYAEFKQFQNIFEKKGLLLLAGATGSGKTSSANAMLDYINVHFSKHIICIEDPIEYRHQNKKSFFTYREVGEDTRSFYHGIMSAMRQNPDVIFVGELRERDAIQSALLAAQTGHLLLATIHGENSTNALLRFLGADENKIDMLAESLLGVVAQKKQENGIIFEILLGDDAVKTLIKEKKFHQLQNQILLSASRGMVSFEQSLYFLKERN